MPFSIKLLLLRRDATYRWIKAPVWLLGVWVCLAGLPCQASDKLCVKTISVMGAKKTKPWVVLRELSFGRGDSIPAADLSKIVMRNQQNVFNLGLFNEVVVEPLPLMKDIHFIIHVKERWYIFPIPKLRVEERNSYDLLESVFSGNFHRLVYGLDLTWDNVSGRNETLDFYGQLGFSKRLRVNFRLPAFLGKPYTDLSVGYSYISNNEIITGTEEGQVRWERTEAEPIQSSHATYLGIRQRFNLYESLNTWLSFNHYTFSDSLSLFNPEFLPEAEMPFAYPSLTVSYRNDRRDWHSFPLKGFQYQLMFRYAGPAGISDTQFAKVGGTWAQYLPLGERWNFSYGVHNVLTIGQNVPFLEKSAIGLSTRGFPGVSSNLRGYERYAIDGSFIHMTKAEWKFALIPYRFIHIKQIPFSQFQDMPFGLYLTAFCDLGYISDKTINNSDTYLKDKWLTGYGVGLNLISFYDRLLRIEFSTNHFGESGIFFHSSLPIR